MSPPLTLNVTRLAVFLAVMTSWWRLTAWWTCVAVVLVAWWRWADYVAAGSRLPGPRAWPLVGNLSLVSADPETLFANLLALHATHGRLVRFWLGPRLVVFMTDPDDIQTVLADPKVINRDYYLLLPFHTVLGDGLLSDRGQESLTNRKLLNQAFSYAALQRYLGTFGVRAEELVTKLDAVADGRTIDPLTALGQMAGEAVRDTVFGINVDWSEEVDFLEMFIRGGRLMTKSAVRPWLMFESVFRWTEDGRAFFNLSQEANKRSSSIIAIKTEEFRKEVDSPSSEDRTRSFMDALIKAAVTDDGGGAQMSVTKLQQHLNHLMVAAVDTSTTALANFLSLMGIHPEIQQQVADELEEIFGDDPRLPTMDDLHRMKVTDRCLKEALRLFTVAPWITREIDKAVTLPSGLVLPPGTTVMVNGFAVHRDKQNYPEPDRYWPDRWLEENSSGHHPYSYVAFGGGRRNCIGQKYAWLEMKTAISCIFRRFRVTTQSSVQSMDRFTAVPILRPTEGYHIQLHRLDK